jgi:Ca2+-binding RTX toxin-like protein
MKIDDERTKATSVLSYYDGILGHEILELIANIIGTDSPEYFDYSMTTENFLVGGGSTTKEMFFIETAVTSKIEGTDGPDYFNFSKSTENLFISGGGGKDTIIGGSGNDMLSGNNGDDYIKGGAGADKLYGGATNDIYPVLDAAHGPDGNDTIEGGKGHDLIAGGQGDDVLYGGPGKDTIYGGAGNDIIVGGPGEDVLYGGEGADQFIFTSSDLSDLIMDFEQGTDLIDISRTGATDWSSSVGDGVTMLFADNLSITIMGEYNLTTDDVVM